VIIEVVVVAVAMKKLNLASLAPVRIVDRLAIEKLAHDS
jgi:hypothetical protein